jgi:transcriptional regulator with XRE-family HTH domain
MAQIELSPDSLRADLVDKLAMGEGIKDHSPLLNVALSAVKTASLIALKRCVPDIGNVATELAKRLKSRIEALDDASQKEVADAVGISIQRLNNWVHGRRTPDLQMLVKLASALNTTTDWLLGAEDTRTAVARAVTAELLAAEGMPEARVEVVLDAAEEAMRLLSVLPDEGDDLVRSRLAARAAWHTRRAVRPQ